MSRHGPATAARAWLRDHRLPNKAAVHNKVKAKMGLSSPRRGAATTSSR